MIYLSANQKPLNWICSPTFRLWYLKADRRFNHVVCHTISSTKWVYQSTKTSTYFQAVCHLGPGHELDLVLDSGPSYQVYISPTVFLLQCSCCSNRIQLKLHLRYLKALNLNNSTIWCDEMKGKVRRSLFVKTFLKEEEEWGIAT